MRSAGAKIYANAIQRIVERDARVSIAGDRVIATAAFKLVEGSVIANILRAGEAVAGRDISICKIATCNPLN